MGWRLVYNNKSKKVHGLFESQGRTLTKQTVFESKTLEGCFGVMDKQELTYLYFSGGTTDILFSGGTRTLVDGPLHPSKTKSPEEINKK